MTPSETNDPAILVILYRNRAKETDSRYIVFSRGYDPIFHTNDRYDLKINLDLRGGYSIGKVRYDKYRVRHFLEKDNIVGVSLKLIRKR